MQFELLEIKTTMSDRISPLDGINSRLDIVKAKISKLEDMAMDYPN